MKKFFLLPLCIIALCSDSFAATRPAARGTRGGGTAAATTGATAPKTVNRGRAAVTAPAKTQTSTSGASAPKTVNRGRAATTTSTKGPTVAARAGVTQKVIGTGTKVAAATKNVVVDEECQQKFDGCMDAFCMIDNASGGRCMCSDKNAEYDAILAEIEKLDQQSYQMATFGVERIEMGTDADAAIAAANAAANSVLNESKGSGTDGKKSSRRTLDLSLWESSELDFDEDTDVFGGADSSLLNDAKGDALFSESIRICSDRIPECKADINMLQMMYAQRVKSDCAAYENSLKQQKKSSQQKLQTAERALREAALDQLRTANKYDLGQCTIEFKKCMQTTGGCGNDFAGCAVAAAMDATNVVKSTSKNSKKQSTYQIKGAITNIEISASTYDNLMAKKPLCESITKQCVAVADQVWDTFLRDVAPQMKNAELIAENNARQNCIGNISSCFQKACKDNIDPKDPDGSYDMCLTRPATMLNVCKVPLNACGIDASSEEAAEQSDIWDYVLAALAAQRVDSCTTAVKECLTSDDRCGKDYTQCIGLDTDTIMRMCPYDKLTGCQQKYGETNISGDNVYDEVATMLQGLWLNIDNAMLEQCRNIVNERVIEICGTGSKCAAFEDDPYMGTDSLITHIDKDGNHVVEGLISFGNVKISKTQSTDDNIKFGMYEVNIQDYQSHLDETDPIAARVVSSLQSTANKINQKIAILTQDPEIQMCVNGRDLKQVRGKDGRTEARFPNLLDSTIMAIVSAGLDQANKNYDKKYNEIVAKSMEAYDDAVKTVLCASMAASGPKCTKYAPSLLKGGKAICLAYDVNAIDRIFQGSDSETGLFKPGEGDSVYATRYVIPGVKVSELASAQQSGRGEFIQTDADGNEIGSMIMTATYSAGSDTCTVTTISKMCAETKAIYDTQVEKCSDSGGLVNIGGSACTNSGGISVFGTGGSNTVSKTTFKGSYCSEYAEPTTTTNTIKM